LNFIQFVKDIRSRDAARRHVAMPMKMENGKWRMEKQWQCWCWCC